MIVLYTRNLNIKDLTSSDFRFFQKLVSDEQIMEYDPSKFCRNIIEAKRFFDIYVKDAKRRKRTHFIFKVSRDKEFIGIAGFHIYDEDDIGKMASLEFLELYDYWNKGYITEAVKGIILYAFNTEFISRLNTNCPKSNLAARRVLEKAGLKIVASDEYSYIYSLSREEFLRFFAR